MAKHYLLTGLTTVFLFSYELSAMEDIPRTATFRNLFLKKSQELIDENQNPRLFEYHYVFKKRVEERKPVFSFSIFAQEGEENQFKGTIVFFHGGPNEKFYYKYNTRFFETIRKETGYRIVSVEIAGSAAVSSLIDDKDLTQQPNYVTQTKTIMKYLRENDIDKNKKYIAMSHSYGAFQLFNYLRYERENSGFDQVISSGGVYNTGSWSFQPATRWLLNRSPSTGKAIKSLCPKMIWELSLFGVDTVDPKRYHSLENMIPIRNPMLNPTLNESLSPFFHTDFLPKIPYLIHVVADDHSVHASQSIGMTEEMRKNEHVVHLDFIPEGGVHEVFGNGFASKTKGGEKNQDEFIDVVINFIKEGGITDVTSSDYKGETNKFYERIGTSSFLRDNYFNYLDWNEAHQIYAADPNARKFLNLAILLQQRGNDPMLEIPLIDLTQFDHISPDDIVGIVKTYRVKKLDASKLNIDVTPMLAKRNENFENALESLILDDTPTECLRDLSYFQRLRELRLKSTKVSDISPLAVLRNLEILDLRETLVTDLSPVLKMKKLTTLYLPNSDQILPGEKDKILERLKKNGAKEKRTAELN